MMGPVDPHRRASGAGVFTECSIEDAQLLPDGRYHVVAKGIRMLEYESFREQDACVKYTHPAADPLYITIILSHTSPGCAG